MYSYNVAVGSWHNMTFVANGTSKTQDFYIDGNLIARLNSSSGSVFNPDILIFGDVTNEDVMVFSTLTTLNWRLWKLQPLHQVQRLQLHLLQRQHLLQAGPTLPTPTLVVSCTGSTSYSGFNVQIIGSLTFNGTGISEAPLLLSYSVTGGKSWIDLTLVNTGSDGSYLVAWMPSVTGNYLLKAVYGGQ